MVKRIKSENVKKWATGAGIVGIPLSVLLIWYLVSLGSIVVTGYSGDMTCAGTLENPCIALVNLTANEDIFIYPNENWGSTPFITDTQPKSVKMYRSWGSGWREINLTDNCKGTWCGASDSSGNTAYSFAFRKGKTYQIKYEVLKNNPEETIKWSFGKVDPYFFGTIKPFTELGVSGMKVVSFKINSKEVNTGNYKSSDFDLKNGFNIEKDNIKQGIYLTNNLNSERSFNFSTLIEINYSEITWNGKNYKLTEVPIIFNSWIDSETGKIVAPNVFFDDKFNKKISYRDIAEKGGYAVAYSKGGRNYIELKIDNLQIGSLKEYYLDPTYVNQTDGFSTTTYIFQSQPAAITTNVTLVGGSPTDFWIAQGDSPSGFLFHSNRTGGNITDGWKFPTGIVSPIGGITTNNSDFWVADNDDDFVDHLSRTGTNISDGFNTNTVGASNVRGITNNDSDLWFLDVADKFVYHVSKTGTNLTGFKLPTSTYIAITTNGSDFWIVDSVNFLVLHVNKLGQNVTEGFTFSNTLSNPWSITSNNSDFWILDGADYFVYHYSLSDTLSPDVSFVTPTPTNATVTTNRSILLNTSIVESNLNEFIWNWNGTNYSIYDDNLTIMFNFNNVSSLGESDTKSVDLSNYGINGVVSNGAKLNMSSGNGGTIEFDGLGSRVTVSDADNLDLNTEITITALINDKDSDDYETIVNKQDEYLFRIDALVQGKLLSCFIVLNGGYEPRVSTTAPISKNVFHSVTCRWSNTTGKLDIFVDGVLNNSISGRSGSFTKTTNSLQIGSINGAWNYNGSIDELKIYNRTLSDDEIYLEANSNLRKYDTNKWSFYVNQSKNVTSLLDMAKYHYRSYVKDNSENFNKTVREITISIMPELNITSPINNSNLSDKYLDINYTHYYTSSCWYSNDTYSVNTSLTNCVNITSEVWSNGGHNLTIWGNNTLGYENYSKIIFVIDSIPPNFTNLENLTYVRNASVNYNLTGVDSGVGVGNWSINWTDTFNITTDGRLRNSSGLTFGEYWINVTVNDTVGNKRSGVFSITYGYLNFNATLNNGITFTFIPTNLTSKGVNATGQNGSRPAIILHNNWSLVVDIYAKVSFNVSNITLKLGNDSNYSKSYKINTTYQKIFTGLGVDALNATWAWADYNWSLQPWFPELEIRCAWQSILVMIGRLYD